MDKDSEGGEKMKILKAHIIVELEEVEGVRQVYLSKEEEATLISLLRYIQEPLLVSEEVLRGIEIGRKDKP